MKRAGLAGSATLVAGSVLLAGAKGIPIPEVAGWIPWGAAAALIAPLAALAVSKAVLGDKLEVELHNGRLYVQWDVPSADAPALMEGAVQVSLPHVSIQQSLERKLLIACLSDYN